jgi:hypothetical protein
MIDTDLLAVKQKGVGWFNTYPLNYAIHFNQSETILSVSNKSDYGLINRIDVQMVVVANRLDNRRRQDAYQYLLFNTPHIKKDGGYVWVGHLLSFCSFQAGDL